MDKVNDEQQPAVSMDLQLVAFSKDNQDGSGSVHVFNDTDELRKHFDEVYDADIDEECAKEAEEKFNVAIAGSQPYEVGTVETKTIKVVVENGKVRLAESLHFSTGQ